MLKVRTMPKIPGYGKSITWKLLPPHNRGRLVTLCPNASHGFLQIVGHYLKFEQANTNFGSR